MSIAGYDSDGIDSRAGHISIPEKGLRVLPHNAYHWRDNISDIPLPVSHLYAQNKLSHIPYFLQY